MATTRPTPATADPGDAISVVLVVAETLLRSGLRLMIEQSSDVRVIGEAERVADVPPEQPDVYVCDLSTADAEQTGRLVARLRPGNVLGLVGDTDAQEVVRILAAGVAGVIAKRDPDVGLVEAIRAAAKNLSVLSERSLQAVLEQVDPGDPTPAEAGVPDEVVRGLDELTPREREVLTEVAAGHSNAEIAERLVLAEATVKSHVGAVLGKLGVAHRSQIVMIAYEAGVVRPGAAAGAAAADDGRTA